jgi:hypothetical protein
MTTPDLTTVQPVIAEEISDVEPEGLDVAAVRRFEWYP